MAGLWGGGDIIYREVAVISLDAYDFISWVVLVVIEFPLSPVISKSWGSHYYHLILQIRMVEYLYNTLVIWK